MTQTVEELKAALKKAEDALKAQEEEARKKAEEEKAQAMAQKYRDRVEPVAMALASRFREVLAPDGWDVSVGDWNDVLYSLKIAIRHSEQDVPGYAWITVTPDVEGEWKWRKDTGKTRVRIEGSMDTRVFRPKEWTEDRIGKAVDHVADTLIPMHKNHRQTQVTRAIHADTLSTMVTTIRESGVDGQFHDYSDSFIGYWGIRELPEVPRPDRITTGPRRLSNRVKAQAGYDHVNFTIDFDLALDDPEDLSVMIRLLEAVKTGRLTNVDALDALLDA